MGADLYFRVKGVSVIIRNLKMAPVEIDHVPVAAVKSLKVVDKAMSLPLVSSACSEVTRMTSPYVESTLSMVTPMMETTWSKVTPVVATVKSQVEEKVMPVIPSKVTETVQTVHNVAVSNISAAVEKVDNIATGGIDQLTEKVPQLKETTPKLIENTKTSVTSYFTAVTEYAASFSVAQVALKAVDASLEMVDGVLNKIGSDEKGTVRIGFRKIHTTANEIRITAVKKSGTEKAKRIEEANIFGAIFEVSGLQDLLELLGFRLSRTDSVYEDEHAKVITNKSETDDPEPVIVDTE